MVIVDPFIQFVLARIGTVVDEEIKFSRGVDQNMSTARDELRLTIRFVEDAGYFVSSCNNEVRECVALIREAAADLDDVTSLHDSGHLTPRDAGLKVQSIFERLKTCRSRLKANTGREWYEGEPGWVVQPPYLNSQQRNKRKTYHLLQETRIPTTPTMDKGIEVLVEKMTLTSGERNPLFFSICGMGGLGKSTLARLVFHDERVTKHFKHLAWVHIGPQFRPEDVWLQIFKWLKNNEIRGLWRQIFKWQKNNEMDGHDMVETLSTFLRNNNCLVVLDDVWGTSTWDSLRNAFPCEPSQSKILITTRNKEVASSFGFDVHELECLNPVESWKFFTDKAGFDHIKTNPQDREAMRSLGEQMVKFCAGLPLAIEVLAGVLRRNTTVDGWRRVLKNVKEYITRGESSSEAEREQYSGVLWLLSLSYDDMSYKMQQCFLHLAYFAKDDRSTKELHQIWMAEGMVSSEDQASDYFDKLVNRYLVLVAETSLTGGVKKYRIHDLIRDLCLTKASEENFLQIKDFQNPHRSRTEEVADGRKVRRLVVYVNDDTKEDLIPLISNTDDCMRSFVCFNSAKNLDLKRVLKPLCRFRQLRVLKFENQTLSQIRKLPKEIGKLISLRFLSLKNSHVSKLPSSISKLVHLQTLDLRTKWKMEISSEMLPCLGKLRHLYLPQTVEVHGKVLYLDMLVNLRTLVNVPTMYCDVAALDQLPELKKLTLCGWERDVKRIARFQRLEMLSVKGNANTERLISSCHREIVKLRLEVRMSNLPESLHSCSNLHKLTLCKNYLQNNPMETLKNLSKLKVLRFEQDAFVGQRMDCSSGGFLTLECLHFNNLQNLAGLGIEGETFPALLRMSIYNCPKLASAAREAIQQHVGEIVKFY